MSRGIGVNGQTDNVRTDGRTESKPERISLRADFVIIQKVGYMHNHVILYVEKRRLSAALFQMLSDWFGVSKIIYNCLSN